MMGEILNKLKDEPEEEKIRHEAEEILAIANACKEVEGAIDPDLVFKAAVQAVYGPVNWS